MDLPQALEEIFTQLWGGETPHIAKLHVLHQDEVSIGLRIWPAGAQRPISVKAVRVNVQWKIQKQH